MGSPHLGLEVLLASPERAVHVLKDLQAKGEGGAKLFEGIRFGAGFTAASLARHYPKRTVNDILADTAGLMQVQTDVQAKINGIEATLKTELGLADSDFIKLPVLFTKEGTRYIAYTPGVVNMLVVTRSDGTVHHCMPKPFGPMVAGECQFEKAIEDDLGPAAATGVTIHFIDDFVTSSAAGASTLRFTAGCSRSSIRSTSSERAARSRGSAASGRLLAPGQRPSTRPTFCRCAGKSCSSMPQTGPTGS